MRMVTSLPIETTHNRRMEGFINDPDLDGSFQINKGLCLASSCVILQTSASLSGLNSSTPSHPVRG